MTFQWKTIKCKGCGCEFSHKQYTGLTLKTYCSRKCREPIKKPNYHQGIYTPRHNWDIIGYDLAYLIDIYDELTDSECNEFGNTIYLSYDLHAIKNKGFIYDWF